MKMILAVFLVFLLNTLNNIHGFDNKEDPSSQEMFEQSDSAEIVPYHFGDLSSCKKCGLVNLEDASDITNAGEVYPTFKYPWMAAIQIGRKKICAGAILSELYVLTAAHCLIKNYTERSGLVADSVETEFWPPEEINLGFMTHISFVHMGPPVEKIIQHSEFSISDGKGAEHDICLLKLKEKIRCSKFMNPICLPPANATFDIGKLLDVSGWDMQESEPDPYRPLKELEIKYVEFEECEYNFHPDLHDHNYCLVKAQEQDPCHIDAGSPMSFRRNGKHYLLGVASMFASDRCKNEEPFVFTSVPYHITWITDETGLETATCLDFEEKK